METLTLSRDDSRNALRDDLDGFKRIKIINNGKSRWSTLHTAIIKRKSDGALFMVDYSKGATECQEERPFDYDGYSIKWYPCEAYEKIVVKYRPIEVDAAEEQVEAQ